MNRDHNKISAQLSSPDATPASTWNRGNVFRHLSLAGWDPNGLSELQHLEEAIQFLEEELDRVMERDAFLAQKYEDDEEESASWTMPIGQVKRVTEDAAGVNVVEETHLPNCKACGLELVQDATQNFKPTCSNIECAESPYFDGSVKDIPRTSTVEHKASFETVLMEKPVQEATNLIRIQHKPVAYAPIPVNGPQTAFQNYMFKPADSPTIPVIPGQTGETSEQPLVHLPKTAQDREIERVIREASFVERDRANQRAADLEAMERDV